MSNNDHQKQAQPAAAVASSTTLAGNDTALEQLKNEILNSINKEERAPLSWGSITVSVVLGLLALISLVQVVQTASLYNKLKSGNLRPAINAPVAPAGGSSSGLPSQVGGC